MTTPPWRGGAGSTRARCVLAPNPGPMTLDGTNTWVLREPGSARTCLLYTSQRAQGARTGEFPHTSSCRKHSAAAANSNEPSAVARKSSSNDFGKIWKMITISG